MVAKELKKLIRSGRNEWTTDFRKDNCFFCDSTSGKETSVSRNYTEVPETEWQKLEGEKQIKNVK